MMKKKIADFRVFLKIWGLKLQVFFAVTVTAYTYINIQTQPVFWNEKYNNLHVIDKLSTVLNLETFL